MTQIKSKFFRQDAKACPEHVEGAQRNAKKLRVLRVFAVSKKICENPENLRPIPRRYPYE
jgi:hypothetical protein